MDQQTAARGTGLFNFGQGFLLAIVANILWGTSFLASKYTLQAWGPFTSAALRFGIATICLVFILKGLKKKIETPEGTKEWFGLFLIATSAFGVLYPMQLAGLKFIPSSLSAAIMLISPLAVLLLGRFCIYQGPSGRGKSVCLDFARNEGTLKDATET